LNHFQNLLKMIVYQSIKIFYKMPATSKSQQKLMGVAYAVKSGYMLLSDVSNDYQDKVKDLTNSITLKQLKDFAETSHENLPESVMSLGPSMNLSGVGNVTLPNMVSGEIGSGDVPKGAGWAEDEYEEEKKKRKKREEALKKSEKPVKTFEQYFYKSK